MFETTGMIDEPLLRSIGKNLLSPRIRLVHGIFCALCVAMASLNICTHDLGGTLFFLLLLAVLLIERFFLQRKTIKTNLARFREACGSDKITYTTRLEETGIRGENHATHASTVIPSEHFVQLAETDTAYILFTKARQFLPVFKNGLEDPQAFLDCLKSKPTHIRW